MLELNEQRQAAWRGKTISATVLYSRAGVAQHIWLENAIGAILIDCADGILRDILRHDFDLSRLQGICFTHGHFDHMGGLHSLLGFLRMIGRENELAIYAPEGCREVFSAVSTFMHNYSDTLPFSIACHGLQPMESINLAEMTVVAHPVVHCGSIKSIGITDMIPAVGYRATYKDESIAVTGDTGNRADIEALVKNADLAIIEATYKDAAMTTAESIERVHLTEELALRFGAMARECILVHRVK